MILHQKLIYIICKETVSRKDVLHNYINRYYRHSPPPKLQTMYYVPANFATGCDERMSCYKHVKTIVVLTKQTIPFKNFESSNNSSSNNKMFHIYLRRSDDFACSKCDPILCNIPCTTHALKHVYVLPSRKTFRNIKLSILVNHMSC